MPQALWAPQLKLKLCPGGQACAVFVLYLAAQELRNAMPRSATNWWNLACEAAASGCSMLLGVFGLHVVCGGSTKPQPEVWCSLP